MENLMIYIMSGVAALITLFWIILFLKYGKAYDEDIAKMDSAHFLAKQLFFIGFGFMHMFKIKLNKSAGRKKEKKLAIVYGEKEVDFYRKCILAGQITYFLTFTPIFIILFGVLAKKIILVFLGLAATGSIMYLLDVYADIAIKKRSEEILSDLPEVLSKLTLLVNAGLIVREAWKKVACTSDRILYREMMTASEEIRNGKSEQDAFYDFAQRCAVKEVRKFVSILIQSIQKSGSGKELAMSLKYLNDESWEEKKHRAKRKGELANNNLIYPLILMFIGVLIMVIVPVFSDIANI